MLNRLVFRLLDQVNRIITEFDMFVNTKKAIIGFSAGPDSVCLLDVLKTIYRDKIDFYLVYINHGLRQKNILRTEEELTRYYARKYKCDYKIIKIKVPKTKKGMEAEARERRYHALITYAKKISAQRIVLGHNLDDLVETFFMNLIRGSGTLGLQSIPAVRLPFVRPLINLRKTIILNYLKKRDLKFSEDLSNLNLNIRRNFIRKRIIPQLLKLNPQLYEVVKREADILHNDEEFLQNIVRRVFKKLVKKERAGFTIDLNRLLYYNKAVGSRVIMSIIKSLKGDLSGFASKHIEAIWGLKGKLSGKKTVLPENLYARKIYGKVFIGCSDKDKIEDFCIPVKIGKDSEIANMRLRVNLVKKFDLNRRSANCEVFDFDRIYPPIVLRNRKAGDVLKIKKGRKKLKEVLNEARVPVNERDNVVLLCDRQGILWVIGICRAYQAYIDKKTRNILKVEFEHLD